MYARVTYRVTDSITYRVAYRVTYKGLHIGILKCHAMGVYARVVNMDWMWDLTHVCRLNKHANAKTVLTVPGVGDTHSPPS